MSMWKECEGLQEELVKMRRELHQIPEFGLDLPETQKYVTDKLDELGIINVQEQTVVSLQRSRAGSQVRRLHSVQIWMHLRLRRQMMSIISPNMKV